MLIDCTLNELKVPDLSGVNPPFGTKKPSSDPSVTAREADVNARLPFARQRPYHVGETSATTAVQAHSAFVLEVPDITLTLGSGVFVGCEARIFNASDGNANVIFGITDGDAAELPPGGSLRLTWQGAWKLPPKSGDTTPDGLGAYVAGVGRNLFDVFGITSGTTVEKLAACFAEIRRRCNNNGEIDESGIPDFTGIQIGDYIDGLDLSAIPANQNNASNTAGQVWNDTYKNNRITVSGFNTYKGAGDTENSKNHILFNFRNIPLKARMNSSDTNTGGFAASVMKTFLDSTFAPALRAQLAGGGAEDYIYSIRAAHSTKSNQAWATHTLWLPTELEVFGFPTYGDEGVYLASDVATSNAARAGWNTNVQFPIFQKSYEYRIKRYNGARDWWLESTPYSGSSSHFCYVGYGGGATSLSVAASAAGGVAPAFCVA